MKRITEMAAAKEQRRDVVRVMKRRGGRWRLGSGWGGRRGSRDGSDRGAEGSSNNAAMRGCGLGIGRFIRL
ncbi:hypothetical protein BHE74_00032311 [Ensete ventricosum]|nr:hypothetical protein GW17_00042158 [Ensete ventricosum]RWW60679.1 hypothetical protein BHE74_00032311 [Ensete ventricosum]RZR96307.1 hypothetical protein BHM03_00025301 [Ensete ventricosum]